MSYPAIVTVPSVFLRSVVRILIVVLFPAPLALETEEFSFRNVKGYVIYGFCPVRIDKDKVLNRNNVCHKLSITRFTLGKINVM